MTAANLTALLAVLVSLMASVIVPIYIVKRKEHANALREAIAEAARRQAGTEVSWEAINRALTKVNDDLRAEIKENATIYEKEILALRERMVAEATAIARTAKRDLDQVNTRLEYCQSEVNRLYRELYGAQRPTSSHD